MIKAIETEYNGYRFRSRLEARWAVFFDALGIKYEYEPEGFDLGNGLYYLPDFLLRGVRGRHSGNKPKDLYVEVKGTMTDLDWEKIARFIGYDKWCEGINLTLDKYPSLYVVGSIPNPDDCINEMWDKGNNSEFYSCSTIDGDQFGLAICVDEDGLPWLVDANYNQPCVIDKKKTGAAFKAARQARFEFGESPRPR